MFRFLLIVIHWARWGRFSYYGYLVSVQALAAGAIQDL